MNPSQSHTKRQEDDDQPFIEMDFQPSVSIEFKEDNGQVRPVPLEGMEKQALLFIATAIYYIFRRTRADAGLSPRAIATYISRLVTQTRKGIKVIEGQIPRLSKAKSLAKAVIGQLEMRYGNIVKHMLLDRNSRLETVFVNCLRKNAKRYFRERMDTRTWFMGVSLFLFYGGLFIVVLVIITVGV